MAFSSLNTFASATGVGISNTSNTSYSSGLYYKTYTGNNYSNNSTYFYGVNNSITYNRGISFFSDANTGKTQTSSGTTTNIVNSSITTFTANDTSNCAITFYGYFKPNTSGTWYFKMGTSTLSNNDISSLWFGSDGETISSLKTNVTDNNPNKYVTYTTWQTSGGFTDSTNAYSVSLIADNYYPILMNWGQSSDDQVLELSFKVSGGSYSTNGSGYFYNSGS